jgi:hypothetical protein
MGSCTKCGAKKGTKSSAGVSLSRIVGCGGRDRAGRARAKEERAAAVTAAVPHIRVAA